jgi:hypothetical protein
MSTIAVFEKGKFAHSASLRYTLPNGHKSHIRFSLDRLHMILKHLEEDGATNVKILHYYDKNGMVIK